MSQLTTLSATLPTRLLQQLRHRRHRNHFRLLAGNARHTDRAGDVGQLSRYIRQLITLEDSLAPMVGCYAHIGPNGPQPTVFASRVRAILRSLNREEGALFAEAFRRVQTFLGSEVRPATRGAVVFSRAGPQPFFLGLQFQVVLGSDRTVHRAIDNDVRYPDFAVDPCLLVLDDALSAVDTYTEEEILSRLRGVMRQRTSIIVSHRVSTVRDADQIFVLDHGRVVERGHHDALVARGGLYAALYRKQLLEEELAAS